MIKKKVVKKKLYRPKKFEIFNQNWKINWEKDLVIKREAYGETNFHLHEIKMQKSTKKVELNEEHIFNTLCHEIAHVVFYAADREDLCYDEKLVNQVGFIVSQILGSIK